MSSFLHSEEHNGGAYAIDYIGMATYVEPLTTCYTVIGGVHLATNDFGPGDYPLSAVSPKSQQMVTQDSNSFVFS